MSGRQLATSVEVRGGTRKTPRGTCKPQEFGVVHTRLLNAYCHASKPPAHPSPRVRGGTHKTVGEEGAEGAARGVVHAQGRV